MQREFEVKKIKVFYDCDKCGDGYMEFIIGTAHYHKCDNCGYEAVLPRIYPYSYEKYVEVKENTT